MPLRGLCTSFSRGLWDVGRMASDFVAKNMHVFAENRVDSLRFVKNGSADFYGW